MKVIQSWDDGLVSDIRLIEILSRYQVKATLCLNPDLYQENRSFGLCQRCQSKAKAIGVTDRHLTDDEVDFLRNPTL